jgi:hypothetical protein
MIPLMALKAWEAFCLFEATKLNFSASELQAMLRVVAQDLPTDVRLCLFVDGLDEFDGDHLALARLLKSLLENPNIKLCAASRPLVVFEDAFQDNAHLRLEQLTYNDIKAYVQSNLEADSSFALLQLREPAYAHQLVENIVSKASGVFLWVRVVVPSLLAGMSHGDRLSDMQRRLDLLPPELERLYEKILISLDPFYLEHAVQLFQIIQDSPDPMTLLLLSFVDEDHWQHAVARPIGPLRQEQIMLRTDTMKRRLNSHCKGLLEACGAQNGIHDDGDAANWTVQYLHRTVKEFLDDPETQQRLRAALKAPFDSHLHLCSGNSALLKTGKGPSFETLSEESFESTGLFWRIYSGE